MPLRQGTPRDSNDPQLTLDVGRVRWTDLLALRSIRQRFFLDQPAHRLSSGQPFQAGLKQLLPVAGARSRVFVARTGRRPVGFAVFGVANPDRRWVLDGIGANLGVYEMQPVWEALVHVGVISAGLEGTKRLYARVPDGSDLTPVLRANGFSPYASEVVLQAPTVAFNQATSRVRRQTRSDVWAIHQLYMATVPQPVQYAEALTSHHWDIYPRLAPAAVKAGWVIEEGYQIGAYLRAESRPESHVLEFMIDPQHGDLFPQLIAAALADLASMAPRQVYIMTRGYQGEFVAPLVERGFSVQLERHMHVKYTTALARAPAATMVNFPQEVKEAKGKRVPTFLNGASADPVSESS